MSAALRMVHEKPARIADRSVQIVAAVLWAQRQGRWVSAAELAEAIAVEDRQARRLCLALGAMGVAEVRYAPQEGRVRLAVRVGADAWRAALASARAP